MNKTYPIENISVDVFDEQYFGDASYRQRMDTIQHNGQTHIFKHKQSGNALISEVVTAEICKAIDAPTADRQLAHITKKQRHYLGVISPDFTDDDTIESLQHRFEFDDNINLSALNLKKAIYKMKHKTKSTTPQFCGQFIDHWLVDSFIGNWDNGGGVNSAVRIKKNHDMEMAPHFDGEKTIFLYTPTGRIPQERVASLHLGIGQSNANYLKRKFTTNVTKFKDALVTLRDNPRLPDICDVTGLEDLYTTEVPRDKLAQMSQNVLDGYKKRIDLFVGQC